MIVFVDNEHERGYDQPWGEKLMANRVRIKYMLEDMAGDNCLLVRWDRVTPELLRSIDARAVFISGNSAQPEDYDRNEQAGLRAVLASKKWPAFGFCGGHQVMGDVYGVPAEPIGELSSSDEAFGEAAEFAPGMKAELGYLPVELTTTHPLLAGLSESPVFRQAHTWELKAVPQGFTNLATTDISAVQLMVDDKHKLVGTQFHPEYATDEHPAGDILIRNFMKWAGLV